MVHRQQSYDHHRHSSYYPQFGADDVNNKNYQQQQKNGGGGKNNNNNNNSSSPTTSSNAVNDNDTFARFWPQPANNAAGGSALLLRPHSCHPCGPISSGANGNNVAPTVENDVRWSKLLRHDGTPSKVYIYKLN